MAPDLKPVDEIRFNQLAHVNPETAQAVMETKVGEPLVQSQLDADMRRLYGTGDFEHVNYRILEEPGKRVLVVDAVEKDWGPNYLRLGIGLSSDFSGATYFNVLASPSHDLVELARRRVAHRPAARLQQQPSDRVLPAARCQGTLLHRATGGVGQDQVHFYSGDKLISIYNIESRIAGLDLGPSSSIRRAACRHRRRHGHPQDQDGADLLGVSGTHYAQGGIRSLLRFDRLDNVNFPRHGWAAELELYDSMTSLGAASCLRQVACQVASAYSFGEGDDTARVNLMAAGRSVPTPCRPTISFSGAGSSSNRVTRPGN